MMKKANPVRVFKQFAKLFCPLTIMLVPQAQSAPVAATNPDSMRLATWNLEHFAYPLSQGCRPRDKAELTALQTYAEKLDADIVALQEVGSVKAVQQLFPAEDWQIVFSDREDSEPYTCRKSGATSTQQKVAFAVKRTLEIQQSESLSAFGMSRPGLRHALQMTVDTPSGSLKLLNVHLKSGCFVDDHSREESPSCQLFSQQTKLLDAWVEQSEQQGKPYAVLGDFNHRLSAPYNRLTRTLSNNSDDSDSQLKNTTAGLIGCHPYYAAPIDHIFVGHMPEPQFTFKAQAQHYQDMEPENMLSDHCAVTVDIRASVASLTNAVKWQTHSAEYAFLTRRIYRRAAQTLSALAPPEGSWVVVMDVDETILDNSPYQVTMDKTGQSFSLDTWNAWIASEKAEMVPGAKPFMLSVLEQGGKLALVTNRERDLDHHTWQNLLAHGLPLSPQNTCLMGRTKQDKDRMDGTTIINDKDLRRSQITQGIASCYDGKGARQAQFGKQQIVMQVGDNIEDYSGVLQEEADVDTLLTLGSVPFVLLPNPMYGSWR